MEDVSQVVIIIGIQTFFAIIPHGIGASVTDVPFAFCFQMAIYYIYKGLEYVFVMGEKAQIENLSEKTELSEISGNSIVVKLKRIKIFLNRFFNK